MIKVEIGGNIYSIKESIKKLSQKNIKNIEEHLERRLEAPLTIGERMALKEIYYD